MRLLSRLPCAWLALVLLGGCVPAERRASWRVYPLPRQQPHDGLAVVSRPGGEGLHLWLLTDTNSPGVCRPRWRPDAARLRGGNGKDPVSGGRASREEFFAALDHGTVRWALRRELQALCRLRAPQRRFEWLPPPRRADQVVSPEYPAWEERDLLSNPKAVLRAEKQLLGQPLTPEDFQNEEPPRPPDGP